MTTPTKPPLTAYSLGNHGFVNDHIRSALGIEPHIVQAGVTIFAESKAEAVRLYNGRKCGCTTRGSVTAVDNSLTTALRDAGHGTEPGVFAVNLDSSSSAPIVTVDEQGAPTVVAHLVYHRAGGFTFVPLANAK